MRPPPSALPDEGICWEASGGRFETHRCRAPPAVASQAASESPPEGGWVKGAARGGRLLVAPTGPNSSGPGSYGHHSSVYVYIRSRHYGPITFVFATKSCNPRRSLRWIPRSNVINTTLSANIDQSDTPGKTKRSNNQGNRKPIP